MPTSNQTQQLPPAPNLDHLKYQARDLLKSLRAGAPDALEQFATHHPEYSAMPADEIAAAEVALSDAQLVIARRYGFASWRQLKSHVDASNPPYSVNELISFHEVVRDHDIDALRRCLDAAPDLAHARIPEGRLNLQGQNLHAAVREAPSPPVGESATALHHVTRSEQHGGSVEVARVLLERGADVNAVGYDSNNDHCTPIIIASWDGGPDMMRLLLEQGADVQGEVGQFALSTAAEHNTGDRFDLLLEYGVTASPNMMVHAGLVDRVLDLVDADPSLLTRADEDGGTLLRAAAARMDVWGGEELVEAGRRLVEALIERGAVEDLYAAAALDDETRIVDLLRDTTHDGDQLDEALDVAVRAGSVSAVRELLAAGANANAEDSRLLHRAVRLDFTEIARMLIAGGAEVNDAVVEAAAWHNEDPECVRLVLDHGGNPNAITKGYAAIHWASMRNVEAVRYLLAAGADANARAPGQLDSTPLHFATHDAEIVAAMLEAGADPWLEDANGETALDCAVGQERDEAAELLRKHMAPHVENGGQSHV